VTPDLICGGRRLFDPDQARSPAGRRQCRHAEFASTLVDDMNFPDVAAVSSTRRDEAVDVVIPLASTTIDTLVEDVLPRREPPRQEEGRRPRRPSPGGPGSFRR